MTKLPAPPAPHLAESGFTTDFAADFDGGLAAMRGTCAQMAPHWVHPAPPATAPVSPALIHGVVVPADSARLLDGMSEYGD